MISRSETARPLLTQGEILQLPEHQEIVMVAGFPPIRALKARFFNDPRLAERVMDPPVFRVGEQREACRDDWTGLTSRLRRMARRMSKEAARKRRSRMRAILPRRHSRAMTSRRMRQPQKMARPPILIMRASVANPSWRS
jgi:type IV secretory pathway TraG/TraD family ATPase VirD4